MPADDHERLAALVPTDLYIQCRRTSTTRASQALGHQRLTLSWFAVRGSCVEELRTLKVDIQYALCMSSHMRLSAVESRHDAFVDN